MDPIFNKNYIQHMDGFVVVKECIMRILGKSITNNIVNFKQKRLLKRNFINDYKQYERDSTLFNLDNYSQKVCEITLCYHSIEKGFIHENLRPRFAVYRVENLLRLLNEINLEMHFKESHIQSSIISLCSYYQYHEEISVDISDYFTQTDYIMLSKYLLSSEKQPVKSYSKEEYFKNSLGDFYAFAYGRHSVRSFTGEMIPRDVLNKVIELANTAPSVCNRQPTSVYIVEDKQKIDQILDIQQGLTGYTDKLNQLLLLSVDRNYFYSIGERYQPYIDGGIYLMNLLYALNYYKIAACPAHWAKNLEDDISLQSILGLKNSEKVVCVIAIGIPTEHFNVTLSERKSADETIVFVE